VMIADSTRSGKRFPDALSKTVPVWCCVINRAIAKVRPEADGWDTELRLPPWVPASEVSQIEDRLNGWVDAMQRPSLAVVLARLAEALERPLRPGWLCPPADAPAREARRARDATLAEYTSAISVARTGTSDGRNSSPSFVWVHCVCASEASSAEVARERGSYTYIQGAGDDEENWARGLTPALWWQWCDELVELAKRDAREAEEEIGIRLAAVRSSDRSPAVAGGACGTAAGPLENSGEAASTSGAPPPVPCALWNTGLLIGSRLTAVHPFVLEHADAVLDVGCSLGGGEKDTPMEKDVAAQGIHRDRGGNEGCGSGCRSIDGRRETMPMRMHVPVEDEGVGMSKRAQPSKDWWQREVFPCSLAYLESHLSLGHRVLICCERGDDRSATVAAAALLALYGEDVTTRRRLGPPGGSERARLTKEDVRARLALLSGAYPAARVSRGLTKELNNFFVAAGGGWYSHELRFATPVSAAESGEGISKPSASPAPPIARELL
jgi:tRNA A64-2'-O-ribosylphosphate transferase